MTALALVAVFVLTDTQSEILAQASANNGTSVALGAAGTFTGAADDLTTFSGVIVNIYAEPASATGTFRFQFSPDGVNWDVNVPITISDPTQAVPFPLMSVLRYFRVSYTNDAVVQTVFRLTTMLVRRHEGKLIRTPTQVIGATEPVTVVRALVEPSQVSANKIPENLAQVNGVTVNVGTGAANTGTQRVAVASDSSITANAGTNLNTSALALDTTQTNRTQKTQITDGTRDGTVKAASTAALATDTSFVVALSPNSPIPAGTAVIGHIIADTGSTTAVTGNVTVVQPTGTNLHAVLDTTSTTACTQATGTNLHVVTDATSVLAANQSVNTAQFGGTNVSTGTGVGGAGIPRVTISSDSSLAANQSVNLAQIAGNTTSTGVGASGTGTQRTAALIHDGTTTAGVIAGTTALKTDMSSVAGTATVTAAAGVQKVGIVGNANAAIDAANNAAAPANVLVVGYQLQSGATATAGTAGQVGSPVASLDHVPYSRLGGPVTWKCSLDNIGATLTQCQAVAGAGLKYYLTDIVIASTTATAGQFLIRTGTGANCVTGTASLFPSAATVVRFPYPGNTSTIGSTTIHLITPIDAPAAAAICIICIATQTCTVQMSGYTAP